MLDDFFFTENSKFLEDFFAHRVDELMARKLLALRQAFRSQGHLLAWIDPLALNKPRFLPELRPEFYDLNPEAVFQGFKVQEWFDYWQKIYSDKIGFEVADCLEKEWFFQEIESNRFVKRISEQELGLLARTTIFEHFLQKHLPGTKRFSLEGLEATAVVLDRILGEFSDYDQIIISMTHRGRLNMMTNVLGKPIIEIFSELKFGSYHDVPYHKGFKTLRGRSKVELLPNPSHLQSIMPVILGKTRACLDEGKRALAILFHGDGAFCGQGVVAESLQMLNLPGYKTEGNIHIVLNNQISFTTSVPEARSSVYATDFARIVNIPVLHVNAYDFFAVKKVIELAINYRKTFAKDIVIDLVGYRVYGHNEADDPTLTAPLMYQKIYKQKTLIESFGVDLSKHSFYSFCALNLAKAVPEVKTEIDLEVLNKMPSDIDLTDLPELLDLVGNCPLANLHPKLVKTFAETKQMLVSGFISWNGAEILAFAKIVKMANNLRITGQDSIRGVFNQRNLILYDQQNQDSWSGLQELAKNLGKKCQLINAPLNEYAGLGFEYGYSLESRGLVIFEAQYGDFINGAQVIIDQYLSSAAEKWQQYSNLVILLPQGLEGQGPEHSSARYERFLELAVNNNWVVAYYTNPSNYFWALLRQLNSKRPLIIMTPKSLLRTLQSSWSAMLAGYQPLDLTCYDSKKDLVVLATGKIFWEIKKNYSPDLPLSLIGLEQLYPLSEELFRLIKGKRLVWLQEEPRNMGAWCFINDTLNSQGYNISYLGREKSPIPGCSNRFEEALIQKDLISRVLQLK